MVTDRERAERLLWRTLKGEPPDDEKWAYKDEIARIVNEFAAVRKERDDLWRKKVVELQKINADNLEVK